MKSSDMLWRTVGIAALLTTVLFIGGFVYAVNDLLNPKASTNGIPAPAEQPRTPLDRSDIFLVGFGDSLTKGTGDVTGQGYFGQLKGLLEKDGKKVTQVNFAVNGYQTEDLLSDLQSKKTVADTLKQANLIVFTIGGNDLFAIARTELNLMTDIDPSKIRNRMPEALETFDSILSELSSMNPDATIVYAALYNPFGDIDETRLANVEIQEWNRRTFELINKYPNMIQVATFDLFSLLPGKYMYSDHFHPNHDGYTRMAERIDQALR